MVRVNAAANKLATAIIEFVLHFEWKRIVMVTLVDGVCGLGASGIYEGLKVESSSYSTDRMTIAIPDLKRI